VTPPGADDADRLRAAATELARLIDVLVTRGVIAKADVGLMRRLGEAAKRPPVFLAVMRDKHAVPSAPIDCASLFHLCRARCCSFKTSLSPDDVQEGKLRWALEEPYRLARAPDGYCTHLERDGCEHYDDRPAACREYDCREDPRVWVDFANKIPAPMPDGIPPRF
jgi:Fe-S-cluster containining protein